MGDKETLEEVEKLAFKKRDELGLKGTIDGFFAGYKLAQEQDKNKYSEEDMIAFGNKMQLVSDVDFDGNVKFAFNPSEAIKQFYNK